MDLININMKKINNHIVKPLKKHGEGKKVKPVKGADIFSLYCNIFICSRKFSGKSTLIYNIIEKTCTKNTTLVLFVSTVYKDDTYTEILKMCSKKNMNVVIHTSLYDDEIKGFDRLSEMVKHLKENLTRNTEDEPPIEKVQPKVSSSLLFDETVQEESDEIILPKKSSRSKWQVPEYLFIFDDLSMELKHSQSVVSLLKDSRHLKAKVLISSQAWTDVPKNARGQFDYYILYKGVPLEKLQDIYDESALSTITYKQFESVYHTVTEKKFCFLYIDKSAERFRQNLDTSIEIQE